MDAEGAQLSLKNMDETTTDESEDLAALSLKKPTLKEKRALEQIRAALENNIPGLDDESAYRVAEAFVVALSDLMGKKGRKPDMNTSIPWQSFVAAYKRRYQVEPVRNAVVNNQMSQIIRRLGEGDAVKMMSFYLEQSDAYYQRNMHTLGHCLKDCEMLYARMKGARAVTAKAAAKVESLTATATASADYLKRKHNNESAR